MVEAWRPGGKAMNQPDGIVAASEGEAGTLAEVRPGYTAEHVVERFAWLREKVDGSWLLLKLEGTIIGWCVAVWSGKKTHPEYPDMQDLYVRPEYRNHGHGTRLIREIERMAKARGYDRVGLAVNSADNAAAKRLYERLGYQHDGKAKYLDGVYDGYEDWVIDLEKRLS
jgi:ribosomal protein S18 acetylase RimI-like enzyme